MQPRDALVVGPVAGAADALRAAGAIVRETSSEAEALELLRRRWCPDLLVVASVIPEEGRAFVDAVRRRLHTCTTAIAVVTPGAPEPAFAASLGGRTVVLGAPFSLQALRKAAAPFSLHERVAASDLGETESRRGDSNPGPHHYE